ncbi:MAG TPA: hypothetical protein VL919_10500 [Vicinamibacterales bacterium]|nr:hypothetical protein [Vicinamibacterales bacterium]
MISGINYPWTIYQGKPNYGCDFGRNKWNSHAGVTAHPEDVRADFEAMAAAGFEVTRWFVFTDGRGGVKWNASGEIAGIADRFFDDMDAALEVSASTNVRLCLVLVDFAWIDDPVRRVAIESSAFLDRVLEPFLDRYGANSSIHSLDVINEPDWVTRELATNPERGVWPIENLRAFVGGAAARIHARSSALVTVGGGQVRFAREWDDAAYGLDFVQVHSYPDVRYQDRDVSLFGMTAADFGLSKPLLIGECPPDPRAHPEGHLSPAYTLDDYLNLARDGGYLGAWPWSFKGVDAFGAPAL